MKLKIAVGISGKILFLEKYPETIQYVGRNDELNDNRKETASPLRTAIIETIMDLHEQLNQSSGRTE